MRFMYSSTSASSVNIEFRPAQASATSSWYGPIVNTTPERPMGNPSACISELATADTALFSGVVIADTSGPGSGTMKIRKNSGNQHRRSPARPLNSRISPPSTMICEPTSRMMMFCECPKAYTSRPKASTTQPGHDTRAAGSAASCSRRWYSSQHEAARMMGPCPCSSLAQMVLARAEYVGTYSTRKAASSSAKTILSTDSGSRLPAQPDGAAPAGTDARAMVRSRS